MTDPPTVQRAVPELVHLVTAMREDWHPVDVQRAIAGAAQIGTTWEQTCLALVRLAIDPRARPGEVIPDHRQNPPRRPDAAERGVALARELLSARKDPA